VKKVLGAIMIFFGGIVFLGTVISTVKKMPNLLWGNSVHAQGRAVGYLIAVFLFLILAVWLIKKGRKLFNATEKTFKDQLDESGS
jgi:hypothetical protein